MPLMFLGFSLHLDFPKGSPRPFKSYKEQDDDPSRAGCLVNVM